MGKSSKKKSKDTIMETSAKASKTTDDENPPEILRDDTQGRKGTGSEESIPVAEKQQMTLALRQRIAFGSDIGAIIQDNETHYAELLQMVNLIVDTTFGDVLDNDALFAGSLELGDALAAGHIFPSTAWLEFIQKH